MSSMYFNRDERRNPLIGESVSFTKFAVPICGGSCDYPFGFISGRKTVYIPDNSVLKSRNQLYLVRVQSDVSVEHASEFGVHKDGISMFRLKKGSLREIFPEILKDRRFHFMGVSPQ